MLNKSNRARRCFTAIVFIASALIVRAQKNTNEGVRFIRDDDKQKVDVIINGSLFTSYLYSAKFEKPFLFPVIAPGGYIVTRGYPVQPREGERVDHPHHTGLWFNYGDVNGIDFWNNSSDIPASKKDLYGHIVNQKIVKTENGQKGTLEIIMNWDDNKGKILLTENTRYIFSGDKDSRTIDHISVLTANETVIIGDSKEGMLAIRVDRAFEMPSNESLVFTDAQGNPTAVKKSNNNGVTGMYISSKGLKGDSVWGTRNEWVILSGIKDGVAISMAMFDNPKNPGFPAYAHARGYGLFSLNNFGQNAYDAKKEKRSFKLEKGQSVTLYHRFYVQSGKELSGEEAKRIFDEFSKEYEIH
jgi:hypothetical protein